MISESQISMDDFKILKVIGRGSYAKVLMVELKNTKQIYAMKVIKKSLVMDEEVREPHVYIHAYIHTCLPTYACMRGGKLYLGTL